MREMKYVIGFLMLFMIIGFATISISLSINGNVSVLSDLDDFKVYFYDVKANGKQDLLLVKSDKELVFDVDLEGLGTTYVIDYDITNTSSVFDASLSINCTQGDDLLSITNVFDTSTNLEAKSTRSGSLTLKKLKVNMNENDTKYSITCSITATAVSRDTEGTGEIPTPIQPISISTGDVISIAGENFNVISNNGEYVTMLAQYNLDTDYRQSTTDNNVSFSDSNGWEYTPGPIDIDIQIWSTNPKTYINEYVAFLQSETGDTTLNGDLITFSQLKNLGCTIEDDYSFNGYETCKNSEYIDWLANGQFWWTRSVETGFANSIWYVNALGFFDIFAFSSSNGIRPVITLPIHLAREYKLKTYEIGEEVSIDTEKFNVISDNGTSVTMLAQYVIGENNRQDSDCGDEEYQDYYLNSGSAVEFSQHNGWTYVEGMKDLDIQAYDIPVKSIVNNYTSYLQIVTEDTNVVGNLVTLAELKELGCTIQDDYSEAGTCSNSPYASWLVNKQDWWTRSVITSIPDYIWFVRPNGDFFTDYDRNIGVRPIITISKETLKNFN